MPHGKSREDIDRVLLARVEHYRFECERLKKEYDDITEIALSVLGSADGRLSMEQARATMEAMNLASNDYKSALRVFTDWVVHGKTPPISILESD